MKTLIYCQHDLGISRLKRTLLLAEAMLDRGRVCLLSSGTIPDSLTVDSRIRLVQLPDIGSHARGGRSSAESNRPVELTMSDRTAIADATAVSFAPDKVIVDMFPFGRKMFAVEIVRMLSTARRVGAAAVYASVQDILVTRHRDQGEYDERVVAHLNRYFDAVLVHSDPALVRLEETFSKYDSLAVPVYYTGYVTRTDGVHRPAGCTNTAVVSADRGPVGTALVKTVLRASRKIFDTTGLRLLIVNGGYGSEWELDRERYPTVRAENSVPDLAALLSQSALSISHCGYNTMADVLRSGVPSIVVPSATPVANEQIRRAEILQKSGRVRLLRATQLSAPRLIDAVSHLPLHRHPVSFDLDGARATAELLMGRHRVA